MNYANKTQLKELAGAIKQKYAKKYDPDATVGTAEQLISSIYEEDRAPYLYRTSGGRVSIGNRAEIDYVEGGAIVQNQLVNRTSAESTRAGITRTLGDNGYILNGTSTLEVRDTTTSINIVNVQPVYKNHVYLYGAVCDDTTNVSWYDPWRDNAARRRTGLIITKSTIASGVNTRVFVDNGVTVTNLVVNPVCVDLTLMFGVRIADYLATLSIDSALEMIKPWIDIRKAYPFDEGTLKHVNLAARKITGFNQWDEEWEVGTLTDIGTNYADSTHIRSKNFIRVISNTDYYFQAPSAFGKICAYDSNQNFVSLIATGGSSIKTIPAGIEYIRFAMGSGYGTTYNNDICINISWSGKHDGEYEPYETETYQMTTGELNGIPTLTSDNKIVYNGDRYHTDGTIETRITIIDLGTRNWTVFGGGMYWRFSLSTGVPDNKKIMVTKFRVAPINSSTSAVVSVLADYDEVFYVSANGYVYFKCEAYDGYSAAQIKEALSGVYMVYELLTPTTTTGTPYAKIQKVHDWGTEEFIPVEGNEVPVGHLTKYLYDLVSKLENQPNSADSDGLYIISQTGAQQSLTPYTAELPSMENLGNNKTYILKVVNKTLTWVEE